MRLAPGLALLSLLTACGGNDAADADTDAGELQPVRGDLEITSIEISQSVTQAIYKDGEVVSPVDYTVPLVPNRAMWVRAMWDPPLEWTPRPLIGRLHLEQDDGTEIVIEDDATAEGEPPFVVGKSAPFDLTTSFTWHLDPEYVIPGQRYSVTVVEPVPANDIPAATGKTRWPREDNTALPISDSPSRLRLSIVGVRYEVAGCSTDTTALPPEELEQLRAGFEVWNAVETDGVIIDTSLSVDINTPMDPFGLLEVVGPIRAQFADIPDAFFFIVLDDCSPFPNGVLGVAPVNSDPAVLAEATTRYGAGLWHHSDVRESINTAVHEIGHAQGANHAPCGGADGPDPAFPHPNASIGAVGLDPLTGQFYDPAGYADFMSYCRPYWVSDYRFKKNYDVMRQLTAWAGQARVTPTVQASVPSLSNYGGTTLAGIVRPGAAPRWWVYQNPMPPTPRMHAELGVALRTAAGAVELATDIRELADVPDAWLVQVPLVDGLRFEDIEAIELRDGLGGGLGVQRSVAAADISDRRVVQIRHR